jgi:hypothetical protein
MKHYHGWPGEHPDHHKDLKVGEYFTYWILTDRIHDRVKYGRGHKQTKDHLIRLTIHSTLEKAQGK